VGFGTLRTFNRAFQKQMGKTHSAPHKVKFFVRTSRFFAVLLYVTQEKTVPYWRKKAFVGAMFSYEERANWMGSFFNAQTDCGTTGHRNRPSEEAIHDCPAR
jgi:hypothetical protein